MKQMTFGRNNGLRVSELALGTGTFGNSENRRGANREEARSILGRYKDAGGNFLDTASNYRQGQSEEILGQLLPGQREDFVLATKYGRGSGSENDRGPVGNGRRSMVVSVERSLKRLNTDYVDVLWAHYDDGVTPVDEIIAAFDDLICAGKVLHGGFSNFAAWRVSRAQTLSELCGKSNVIGIQVEHNLIERSAERELLPMAAAFGLGAALYSPLGGGFLTAKHRNGESSRGSVVYTEDSVPKTQILDALIKNSRLMGVQPAELAIAWQRRRRQQFPTPTITVAGARSLHQLDTYLRALDLEVEDAILSSLDKVSEFTYGAPFDSVGGPTDLGDDPDRFIGRTVPAN